MKILFVKAQIHSTEEAAGTEHPRWFTPGVRGIGLASFLADVGHEIPTALFASLVTITLSAPASILRLLEGLAIGCIETSEHAAVATLAPSDVRGSAFGLLAAIQSFGNLIASGVAGLLWRLASPTAAFVYLAIRAGLSLLVLSFLQVRRETAKTSRS